MSDHDDRLGFTLIELIVVITILGILAAFTAPQLTNISPKYRLRSEARKIASQIGWTRSMSAGTDLEHVLRYDLDEQLYWRILPPGEDDDPELDVDDRPTDEKFWLEEGIRIKEIRFPDGSTETNGIIDVYFDGFGNQGSHIVIVENELEKVLSVKFSALIGSVDFSPEEIEFEEF